MTNPERRTLAAARELAQAYRQNARVPYSSRSVAAVAILSSGRLVPGVRVESASFSLSMPAVANAISTALALENSEIVALVSSSGLGPLDLHYADHFIRGGEQLEDDVFACRSNLPVNPVGGRWSPSVTAAVSIAGAREIAGRAVVPESDFPVGCMIDAAPEVIGGVNVEHPDWTLTICAERNALSTMVTMGATGADEVYLSCTRDTNASPCGACRQWLSELVPEATIWIDRGEGAPPEAFSVRELLPGSFTGDAILR